MRWNNLPQEKEQSNKVLQQGKRVKWRLPLLSCAPERNALKIFSAHAIRVAGHQDLKKILSCQTNLSIPPPSSPSIPSEDEANCCGIWRCWSNSLPYGHFNLPRKRWAGGWTCSSGIHHTGSLQCQHTVACLHTRCLQFVASCCDHSPSHLSFPFRCPHLFCHHPSVHSSATHHPFVIARQRGRVPVVKAVDVCG